MGVWNSMTPKKIVFLILSFFGAFSILSVPFAMDAETIKISISSYDTSVSDMVRIVRPDNGSRAVCNKMSNKLVGPIPVIMKPPSWDQLNKMFPEVEVGGRWRPKTCTSRHHVGIVVPYRDRDEHLRVFLRHMHAIFAKQELDYGIYVIEQDAKSVFNRGMLMNIGFVEALKADNYSCFVFSDVDLLPEDDRNIYGCPSQPRHLSVSIDSHGYKLMYRELFGGVENFQTSHYKNVNGFSNIYFGWGSEDDDLVNRISRKGYELTRPPMDIARYKMKSHVQQSANVLNRLQNVITARSRMDKDGLNSLKYKVVALEKRPLYTLVSVVIDQAEVLRGHSTTDNVWWILRNIVPISKYSAP